MTQGGAKTRIALGLAASVLACLMLPAAAQAQYPYDWHAATPPSWFAESTDSSCQPREQYNDNYVDGAGRSWSLLWASSPGSFGCSKPIPPSPELGPGIGFYCNGTVSHTQIDGSPDDYLAVWSCSVEDVESEDAICTRNSQYAENPLGDPDESYNSDSGGWYDPYTFEAYDCRPEESADTSPPKTVITKDAPKKTDSAKIKVKFTSSEPNSTFECKLDKKSWKPCSSPTKLKHLKRGKHKFKVRAIDAAGNVDPSPAKDKFKVVG